MSYEIDYADVPVEIRDRKAINDAIRYNRKAVKALLQAARYTDEGELTKDGFLLYCSFAGIQGLPAHAMWRQAKKVD